MCIGLEWDTQFCVLPTEDKISDRWLLIVIFVPQTGTFLFIGASSVLDCIFFLVCHPWRQNLHHSLNQLLLYFYTDSNMFFHCIGLTFRNARIVVNLSY